MSTLGFGHSRWEGSYKDHESCPQFHFFTLLLGMSLSLSLPGTVLIIISSSVSSVVFKSAHCFLLTLHSQPFRIGLLSSRKSGESSLDQSSLSVLFIVVGCASSLCLSALSPLEQFLSAQTDLCLLLLFICPNTHTEILVGRCP